MVAPPPLLVRAPGLDHPGRSRLNADDWAIFARRHNNQVSHGDGRGHEAIIAAVAILAIEIGDSPDLAAILKTVGRAIVVAMNDQVGILTVLPEAGRRVGM